MNGLPPLHLKAAVKVELIVVRVVVIVVVMVNMVVKVVVGRGGVEDYGEFEAIVGGRGVQLQWLKIGIAVGAGYGGGAGGWWKG